MYGNGVSSIAIIKKMELTSAAGFSPIFIGSVTRERTSPFTSCTSLRVSLPVNNKKTMTESNSEEKGFPTAAPPKVNDNAERKATIMLPANP